MSDLSPNDSPIAGPSVADHSNLEQVVLKLRDDLSFVPQSTSGNRLYVVEDRLSGKCYRLGTNEYQVATMLDGTRTLADIIANMNEAAADSDSPSEDESRSALQVCKWLLQSGLASIVTTDDRVPNARPALPLWSRFNPIFVRVPLLSPDQLLEHSLPWIGWIHTRIAMMLAGLLAIGAGILLAADWNRFSESAGNILSVDQGLYLLLGWIVLKVAHEMGHGLACKYHGGYVREAGVAFLLFAPIPYVDVTSSWRLRSKWERIHVAAAGVYVEGVIGSLAVVVWSQSTNVLLSQFCVNLIVMATATTVLFNANPLMRFDGYYILADWLEIPNLYSRGQQFTSMLFRRLMLGEQVANNAIPSTLNAARIINLYGVVSWVWRIMVCLSLVCAASLLFHGAGVVLAVTAAISWFLAPAWRLLAKLLLKENWPQLQRFTATTAALAAGLTLFLLFVPSPFPRRSPGIVEYKPMTTVRSESGGFVREILVSPGDTVREGDVIAQLENRQLEDDLQLVELAIQQSEVRSRLNRQRGEMSTYQAEQDKLVALQAQYKERLRQVEGLIVRAPADGKIIGRRLPILLNSYVKQGDELCRVGKENEKEVQLSIHQDDVEAFQDRVGSSVAIRGPGGLVHANLSSITPRATDLPTHPALCSSHGGPLPVQARSDDSAADSVRLLEPRFVGHVFLPKDTGAELHAGQLCTISIRSPKDSVGRVAATTIRDWFASKLR